MAYLIPDTAIRAGMFAYIAGSSFVFISIYGFSQLQYSLIFGINGLGIITSAQINRYLLNRYLPQQILKVSIFVALIMALTLFLGALLSKIAILLIIPLFLFIATLNFISPNAMALAMKFQGKQAGSAAAIYGSMQWVLASFASIIVSHFHNGTVLPMAGSILFCGIISFIAYKFKGYKD